jgi:surface adhesion protein
MDFINAGDNRDMDIDGGGGPDSVHGGAYDDDSVAGSGGDDILGGDNGNDTLFGESQDDGLIGGPGFDILHGGGGADTFFRCSNDAFNDVEADRSGSEPIITIDPLSGLYDEWCA